MEFEFSAQNVHQQLHDRVHGCQSVRKEDGSNDDGEISVEAEGLVKRTIVDEDREEGEDVECMELESVRYGITVGQASDLPVRYRVIWSCAQDSNVQAHVPIRQRLLPSRFSLLGCRI